MDLEKEIIEIVKSNISYSGEITIDSTISEDLDIGSFDKLMIINAIEDKYLIKLNENILSEIKSIKDIIEIVRITLKS
jgi:acyl carrier protein